MKHNIRALIKSRKLFFGGILYILLAGVLSLLFFGNSFGFISLSAHHPFWLNVFFINYTFMGDSIFAICMAAVLIYRFKRKQPGMALLYALLISGIFIQVIKNYDSYSSLKFFFENGQYLFSVEDNQQGFISGHTAIAFALATLLILVLKNKDWQLPLLAGALLVGYSRIYLAQHFLSDILFGAVIGSLSGIIAVYLAYYFKGIGYYLKKFFSFNNNNRTSVEGNIQRV